MPEPRRRFAALITKGRLWGKGTPRGEKSPPCERGVTAEQSGGLTPRCGRVWGRSVLTATPQALRASSPYAGEAFIVTFFGLSKKVTKETRFRRQRHSRLRRRGDCELPAAVPGLCIPLNLRCVHLMRHVECSPRPLEQNASSSEGTDDSASPGESLPCVRGGVRQSLTEGSPPKRFAPQPSRADTSIPPAASQLSPLSQGGLSGPQGVLAPACITAEV